MLETEEHAAGRPLGGGEGSDVLAAEADGAAGDLVVRVGEQRVGEGRLARAVRAHQGVELALATVEAHAAQDLPPFHRNVEVVDLEHGLGQGLRGVRGSGHPLQCNNTTAVGEIRERTPGKGGDTSIVRSVPRMDDVTRLTEIESIKQLKARYFRFLDTKDWDAWQGVFTGEARMDVSDEAGDAGRVQGAAAIVEFVRGNLSELVTCHHGHMPEIEITSPTSASGIWAMEDLLQWPLVDGARTSLHGWGHYHETYVKLDDGWHIDTLKLTRLRVDVA